MDNIMTWLTVANATRIGALNFDTILTIAIPLLIAAVVSKLLHRYMRLPQNLESPKTKTYFSAAKSIVTTIVYLIAIYQIMVQLHINVTPLFASAGVIGIIVGLGVRSFIEDFFTGMLILTQDTISVGDYVEIGGSHGITEAVGLRTVRIKDQNGAIHIFPNREIKKIVNYSRRTARVVVDIPIKSNQSVDKATKALLSALKELKKDKVLAPLIKEGSSVQGVEHISSGTVTIRVLILTRAAFRWDTARKYRYLALQELTKAKILLG